MGAGFSIIARGQAEADIYLYEDIGFFGGVTAKRFADELKTVAGVQTLNVRINSNGGDVFDGMAIYNQLAQHPARVITHIDGVAASIASVIAMAGDVIRISESGFMMIHNARGGAIGEAGDLRKMADTIDTVTASIAEVYQSRTGKPVDDLRAMMDAETWFNGNEALAAGFADEMVTNLHVAARFDPKLHAFKNAPAALTAPPCIVEPEVPADRPRLVAAQDSLTLMRARLRTAPQRPA